MAFQEVQFIIDSFDSTERSVCNCKRDGEQVCTCEEGKCKCNHVKFDTIYIQFPKYFVQSSNTKKYVSILLVRLFDIVNKCEITASMHTNLIRTNESADNYCCACNIAYPVPKNYICSDNKDKFETWFRDINGDLIDLDPTKTRAIIECVLYC